MNISASDMTLFAQDGKIEIELRNSAAVNFCTDTQRHHKTQLHFTSANEGFGYSPQQTYDNVAKHMFEMSYLGLFTGDYGLGTIFDIEGARGNGFTEESISIAINLNNLNNEVISKSKSGDNIFNISIEESPENLIWFLENSNKEALYVQEVEENIYADISNAASAYIDLAEVVCGGFGNHKPASAKSWNYFEILSPTQTLESWGYHKTGDNYKGVGESDWTRPQNYNPVICGYGSFRDHALIVNGILREQNYDGWSPRGEPNPELNTYRWPYPTWPLYVYMWHSKY